MSKNAMAGAVTLCGVGLCMIGGAMMMQLGQQAQASASAPTAAAAVSSAATAQAGGEPTVVWMGVTTNEIRANNAYDVLTYHRLWSDGRLEVRHVQLAIVDLPECPYEYSLEFDECALIASTWREVPPPPGSNGFACRSDINGDRIVDGTDLAFILNSWGQEGGCEPEATYPCLDLGNLAGGVAFK